jgi:hypothetical protein
MLIYSETSFLFIQKCEVILKKIISEETDLQMRKTRFAFNNYLFPIHIVVFEGESKLGYFDPNTYQIGLNKSIMTQAKDSVLKDIIRHEFAHYVTFIKHGNVDHHGKEFKEVCEQYNWDKDISHASANIEIQNNKIEGDIKSEKVINKIKNLLKLADSDNQHEAQLATLKANQLLLKHNIESLDTISEETYYVINVLSSKRKNAKMSAIYSILKHFMVKPVLNYTKGAVLLEVAGTRYNIELSEYVAGFLDNELDRLWLLAKKESKLTGLRAKNSFFYGVAMGYDQKMSEIEKEFSLNDSKSLIVIKDQLEAQTARIYKRLSSSYSNSQKDTGSHELGKAAGKSLSINKGISKKSNKLLGWLR